MVILSAQVQGNEEMASVGNAPETTFQPAAFPPLPVCRLGVDQYEEMIRAGIVTKDSRIELLDGWLVPKMTKNPPHVLACELARNAHSRKCPLRAGASIPRSPVA